MLRALKVVLVLIALMVGLFVFIATFSSTESSYACMGKITNQDEPVELFVRLEEYRWWVSLWSESDASIWLEFPNELVQHYPDIYEVGPQLQIHEGPKQMVDPIGNFSTISKTLAIQTPVGFFDGKCTKTE